MENKKKKDKSKPVIAKKKPIVKEPTNPNHREDFENLLIKMAQPVK